MRRREARRLTARDADRFARSIAGGGVAVFPADTVYGLACDPSNASAVARLHSLKGRRPAKPAVAKPAAVMFFDVRLAARAVSGLGPRPVAALRRLLPGPVTVVVPNPERIYPLACGQRPDRVGLRVPRLVPSIAALGTVEAPILQSSANPAGGPDAREVEEIDESIVSGVDLVLDAGRLVGNPSTVVDISGIDDGLWSVLREGAMPASRIDSILGEVVTRTGRALS